MFRPFIGGGIGIVLGVLTLAVWGFVDGCQQGVPTAKVPPGVRAGLNSAFVFVMYLWPIAASIGGLFGFLAGLGSWLTTSAYRRIVAAWSDAQGRQQTGNAGE